MSARKARPTREYSRAFTVKAQAKRRQFNIDPVPADLYKAVRDKLKCEGKSLRSVVLTFLEGWAAQ